MTTDSLTAGAGLWSALRIFVQEGQAAVFFSQPNLLNVGSGLNAGDYAAKHKTLRQVRAVDNQAIALFQPMCHHVPESIFGIGGNKTFVLVPLFTYF